MWPVTPPEGLSELGAGKKGIGRLLLPEGHGVWGQCCTLPPFYSWRALSSTNKTWKWLRKMEPPKDHCLGWGWVSRKHIGWVVGDT